MIPRQAGLALCRGQRASATGAPGLVIPALCTGPDYGSTLDPMTQGAKHLRPDESLHVLIVVVVPDLMTFNRPLLAPAATDFAPACGCGSGGFLDPFPLSCCHVVTHVRAPTGTRNQFNTQSWLTGFRRHKVIFGILRTPCSLERRGRSRGRSRRRRAGAATGTTAGMTSARLTIGISTCATE